MGAFDMKTYNAERAREYKRRFEERHPGYAKAYSKAWAEKNRDKIREQRIEYYNSDRGQDSRLRSLYGISLAEWKVLFEKQSRHCACCGATEPGRRYRWATDHDHETKVVRGILCNLCNTLLGKLGDSTGKIRERVAEMLRYLEGKPWEP